MNKELLYQLQASYTKENLDLMGALKVWREANLSPSAIRDQVRNDIGRGITAAEAAELYHIGESMKSDYDTFAKQYEVSKGRDDLIPPAVKDRSIKLTPSIKMSMERVGQNMFRDKVAKTYWTMKEKIGDDGSKSIFLVAIDEPDEKKEASSGGRIKTAAELGETQQVGNSPSPEPAQQTTGQQAQKNNEGPDPNVSIIYALAQTVKSMQGTMPPDQLAQFPTVQKLIEATGTQDLESALKKAESDFTAAQGGQKQNPQQAQGAQPAQEQNQQVAQEAQQQAQQAQQQNPQPQQA